MKLNRLAPILAASACFAAPASAQLPQDSADLKGVFAGSYVCEDGEHGVYLDIRHVTPRRNGVYDVEGVLGFFPTIGGKGGSSAQVAGSFEVRGEIKSDGKITLTRGAWLKLAGAYGGANLEGKLEHRKDGLWSIKGKPVVPGNEAYCTDLVASQFLPR